MRENGSNKFNYEIANHSGIGGWYICNC